MRLRQWTLMGLVSLTAATAFAVPAYACHRGGYRSQAEVHPAVCEIEQCDETGLHYHDEILYCGYGHTEGYCDGSCARSARHSGCGRWR